MRNLKRVLSLALAAIMLLGMMVMGTGAANVSDFTDYDQITNQEAAAITAAIGIFDGYPDGSFGAVKEVDRATMATIICKIIYGADVNANPFKGSGRFTDLAGYEWAEGYINMCSTLGIVNGTGNNTFSPGATVTTWQAALMLQRALGWWNASDPATSTINELTVTSKAQELGLYGRLNLNINAPLTRNDVAELVLNAVAYNVPVDYSPSFNTYYRRGGSVFSGVPMGSAVSAVNQYTLGYTNFDLVGQFETDEFGRPGQQWGFGEYRIANNGDILQTVMREKITFAPNDPVVTYTKSMKLSAAAVTKALKNYTFTRTVETFDPTSGASTISTVSTSTKTVDGVTSSGVKSASDIVNLTADGVIVEVYSGANTSDAQKITQVVVIRPQVANVTSVNARSKTVTLSMNLGVDGTKAATYVVREDDPFYPVASGAQAGDVLLGVYGNNGLLDLWVPDSVTGTITEIRWNVDSTDTVNNSVGGVDKVRYPISSRITTDANHRFNNNTQINNTATVYLDRNGYAMYVAPATIAAVSNYLYVTNVWQVKEIVRGIPTPTNYARGVNAEGEIVTLKIANNIFQQADTNANVLRVDENKNPTATYLVDNKNFPGVQYAYAQTPGKAYVFDNRAIGSSNNATESQTGRGTDGKYTDVALTASATASNAWHNADIPQVDGSGNIVTGPDGKPVIQTHADAMTIITAGEGFIAEYQQGKVDSDLYLLKVPAVGSDTSAGVIAYMTGGLQSYERTIAGVYMATDVKFVSANYNAVTDRLTASASTGVQYVKRNLTYVPVVTQDSAGHRLITTVYVLNGTSYTTDLYYVSGDASYRVGYTDASGRPAVGYNNGLYLAGTSVDTIAVKDPATAGFYQKVDMDGDAYVLEEYTENNRKIKGLIADAYNRSILVDGAWYDVSNAVWTDLTKNGIDSIDSIRAIMGTGIKLRASFTYDSSNERKVPCLYITNEEDKMLGDVVTFVTAEPTNTHDTKDHELNIPPVAEDAVIAVAGNVIVNHIPPESSPGEYYGYKQDHMAGLDNWFLVSIDLPGTDTGKNYAVRINSPANDPDNWTTGTYPWGSDPWKDGSDANQLGTNDNYLYKGVKRMVGSSDLTSGHNLLFVVQAGTVSTVEVMLETEIAKGSFNTKTAAETTFDGNFTPSYTLTIDCTGVEPVTYVAP